MPSSREYRNPNTSYGVRRPLGLTIRMLMATSLAFVIVFAAVWAISQRMGLDAIVTPIAISVVLVLLQYMVSPWIVGWTMNVQWVSSEDEPELHAMVAELAEAARIPMPRVGISNLEVPNAFAYGRWLGDARVVVTRALLDILAPDQLRAVLGHEIVHIRNRDVAVMTFLSLMPNIFYYIYRIGIRMRGRKNPGPLIAIGALLVYAALQLIVLFISRVREYAADEGSVLLGNSRESMASALYQLVYGASHLSKEELRQGAGFKAFFASDPSRAGREMQTLAEVDRDGSGHVDSQELEALRESGIKRTVGDAILELVSTHPNMSKRLERLARLEG